MRAYPLIDRIESHADFEVDMIRDEIRSFERYARGVVKGPFSYLAGDLYPDEEADQVLASGTRTELLALVRSYTRLLDSR